MINTANVANIAGMVTDDEKKIKSINEMAETCKANVASQERCQYASDLIICLVGEANYHGRLDWMCAFSFEKYCWRQLKLLIR